MARFSTAQFLRYALLAIGSLLLTPGDAQAQTPPASEGLVADTTELRILRQFYDATNGAQWANNTHWLTGTTLADAATWFGVDVAQGDVVGLALPANNVSGALPAVLGQLRGLQTLELWRNALSDAPLPAALGQLANLRVLTLHQSGIPGPLPVELGQLTRLQVLSLNNNQLVGQLPAQWGQLAALRFLNVSDNQLSGTLPDSLARLRQLTYLGVARNRLSGPLTPLAGLTALEQLDAEANAFTGTLDGLAPLPALESISLGHNQLSGSLAPLAPRPRLRWLDLRGNTCAGTLPASLLEGPALQVLFLDGNALTDIEPLSSSFNPAAALGLTSNELSFAALERLYQGPNQSRLYVEAGNQRPPTPLETISYQANQPLVLRVSAQGEQHGYRYQWQRLVGGQWLDMPGDTLATKRWAAATAAEQGTYRRVGSNRWFTDPTRMPTRLHSAPLYADLVPYQPLPRNRPDDANTGLALATPPPAPDAAAPRPADVNYVRTWTPRVALTTLEAAPTPAEPQALVVTQYLDGLGRPLQTVQHRASPQGRDLVQPVAYDALGRSPQQFLPYAADTAHTTAQGYHYRALAQQQEFYARTTVPGGGAGPLAPGDATLGVARTGRAYAETVFEASPLGRVLAQGAAGEAGQLTAGHIVERTERSNTAADSVLRFTPGYPGPDPGYAGFYAPGELWGTEVADTHGPTEPGAHGYRTIEWKDKQGRLVLRQVEASRARTTAGRPGADGTGPVSALYARWLRTAYAYDDFGRLRYVVQPEGTRRLLALTVPGGGTTTWPTTVNPFVFHYRYDGRGRQIAKQVPGQDGETEVVYDHLDRPVLSQDPVQRTRHEWSVTKYDALGRVVLTGLLTRSATDTLGRASLQALAAADTAAAQQYEVRTADGTYADHYTYDRAFPRPGQQGFLNGVALSVTYYDDYDFDNDGTAEAAYDPSTDTQFAGGTAPVADAARTTGLVTRTKTRVLGVAENDPTQAAWLTTTTFYDERARPVQVQTTTARKDELTGRAYTDLLTTQLDFMGKVVQSVAVHTGPNHAPVTVAEFFTYDPTGRLLTTRQQLPGEAQPARLSVRQYNELGQLAVDSLGTGRLLQPVKYAYNIRGGLTSLNNPYYPEAGDLFNLSLHYETGFTRGYEQYNGNLTGQTWRGRDGVQRAYGYAYDPLNRLLQGDFVARTPNTVVSANSWHGEEDNYRLSFASYDDNGNLKTLRRRGLTAGGTHATPRQYGPVDMLTYTYQGNRLLAVEDQVTTNQLPRPAGYHGAPTSLAGDFQEQGVQQATEYDYDANGSMTADRNKGLSGIAYNHLSLPRQIHFGSLADSIVFRYSAAGQKVAKLVYQSGRPAQRTDYLSGFQYEADSLRFFPHAAGRVLRFVSVDAAGQPTVRYEREYSLKDHLGNLRLAYRPGHVRRDSASLEPDAASHRRESQQFDSLSVSAPIAQNVGSGIAKSGSYVAKLNAGGNAPQPLGPLKQLAVQKGDTVTVSAYGLYPTALRNTFWYSLASFLTGLFHPAPGAPVGPDPTRGRAGLPLLQVGVAAGLTYLPQLSDVPKGYLRVLVFNADSALVSQHSQQLTAAALGNYERLRLRVLVPQDGYVTAFVGNESDVDVYFDDVTVELRQGLQVQETHYDPTGLELAGLTGTTPGLKALSQYKFNGKEFQPDLGLNWNHHDARFYDTQLGRWHVTDPLAEKMRRFSPYNFGFSNPIRFIDPDGLSPNPGDFFKTKNEAAIDFSKIYNGPSILINREYTTLIYTTVNESGESGFTYAIPAVVGPTGGTPNVTVPLGADIVGVPHTHGAHISGSKLENDFSEDSDIVTYDTGKVEGYVATPNGSLKVYHPDSKTQETIPADIASDPNLKPQDRVTSIDPQKGPVPGPSFEKPASVPSVQADQEIK